MHISHRISRGTSVHFGFFGTLLWLFFVAPIQFMLMFVYYTCVMPFVWLHRASKRSTATRKSRAKTFSYVIAPGHWPNDGCTFPAPDHLMKVKD